MKLMFKIGLEALKDKEKRKKILLILAPVAFFLIIMPVLIAFLLLSPIVNAIDAISSLKSNVSSFFEKFGNLLEGREFAIINVEKVKEKEKEVYQKLNDVYSDYQAHSVILDAPLILSTIYYPMTTVYDEDVIAKLNDMEGKSDEELTKEEEENNERLYDYYKRVKKDIPNLAKNSVTVTITTYKCNAEESTNSDGEKVVSYSRGELISTDGPKNFDGNFKDNGVCGKGVSSINVYSYQLDAKHYDDYLKSNYIINTNEYDFPQNLNDTDKEKKLNSIVEDIHELSKLYYDFFDGSNYYSNGISALCMSGVVVSGGNAAEDGQGVFSLEDYVAGVIAHENEYQDPNNPNNIEAMKAQAIAARTYTLSRTNYCTKPIRNGTEDQTFYANRIEGRAKQAVQETAGLILTYNGEIFSSEYDSFYCTEVTTCPIDGMCSCEYTMEPVAMPNTVSIPASFVKFSAGGHGRGMSQVAARYLQTLGKNYKEILETFYSPGVQITQSIASGNDGSVTYANGVFTIPANANSGYPEAKGSGKYYLNIYFWQMLDKFLTAASSAGHNIGITDGWRSYEAQVSCKKEKPTLCATPGKSMHGWGIAADLDYRGSKAATDWAHVHAAEYGLEFTVCNNYFGGTCTEPWHIEPINIEYK